MNLPRELLEAHLEELASSRKHLDFSFQRVSSLPSTLDGVCDDRLESVEAFTGRFARAVDLLVNKVLRSLDRLEMKPHGTLLDVVNRAEKRGFIDSADELREMKDIRNIVAHDYAGEKLAEIFTYCRTKKPVFDAVCEQVIRYIHSLE